MPRQTEGQKDLQTLFHRNLPATELSYTLAEHFNICLKECMHVRMLGIGLPLKTTALLLFFLWLVKSL